MSKWKLFFIVSGIVVGVLVIGALVMLKWDYRRDGVTVTIKNKSGFVVDTLVLQHGNGEIRYYNFYDDDEIELCYPSSGESSYQIIALLNDTILQTRGMYAESGYSTTETIFSDTIISSY